MMVIYDGDDDGDGDGGDGGKIGGGDMKAFSLTRRQNRKGRWCGQCVLIINQVRERPNDIGWQGR